tara:strand:- start:4 stop:327 length:324 start_codon:yes stop_codon:yes gene_type:complete
MPIEKTTPQVTLLEGWFETERGNIWLVSDDIHMGYFKIEGDIWLEVSVCPENTPGFNICTIEATEEELAKHITKEHAGYFARKLNIDGVSLYPDSRVVGLDEELDEG